MRFLWLTLLLLLCAPSRAGDPDGPVQSILNLLDYVAVEYPGFVQGGKVLDADEYAEQVEFSGQVEQRIRALPPKADRDALGQRAQALQRAILDKREGAEVVALAREIQRGLIRAYDIQVTPRKAPDVAPAQALYSAQCANCHGAQGRGDGPAAPGLDPRPTDFQDAQRAAVRSVFGLYNTISAGVGGTAMPGFGHLSAEERWALAFRVSQFSATDAERSAGEAAWRAGTGKAQFATLGAVVMMTPSEARSQSLEDVLAYLRSEPRAVEAGKPSPIGFSIATLERSRAVWREGRSDEAYRLAVTAYLEGFELAEAAIDSADRGLRTRTEQAMMAYRNALHGGAPVSDVESAFESAMGLLREAQQLTEGHATSAAGNFVSSLVIILREGLEAILVLAAMAAFLTRSGRREGLPWLHGGWIAALGLGGLTWLASSKLISISGAQREVTEGVTALISAAVLLYVGFWLHSKSSAAKWTAFIKQQMAGAAGGSTWFGVGLVAFLAVYREVFETVLFYQALWVQSDGAARAAVLGGLATGVVGLVVLAWLIIRFSVRLPLGLFFGVSGALLAVMAVVFAGQGIAALQAAGRLPVDPVSFPSIPVLGIYPNLQGLVLQLVLVAFILSGFAYLRAQTRRARPSST
jgi:high-affinity iron transporter